MKHPKQPQKAAREEDPEKVEWEERAIELESSTKHGHGVSKMFRIERVARMIVEGKRNAQICATLGQEWHLAPRTIQHYMRPAGELLAKRVQQSAAMQRGKQLARLDMAFRMAVAAGNIGAMLDTIKVTNIQQGLNATEQRSLALTGGDGAPLMAIVELPAKDAGGNQQALGMVTAPAVGEGEGEPQTDVEPV